MSIPQFPIRKQRFQTLRKGKTIRKEHNSSKCKDREVQTGRSYGKTAIQRLDEQSN